MKHIRRLLKLIYWLAGFVAVVIVIKLAWGAWANHNLGTVASEKEDVLGRRNYAIDKIVVPTYQLLDAMPRNYGEQLQGEWALYSCSMLAQALANIAHHYPETKGEAELYIDKLIQMVMTSEMQRYDAIRWNENPLKSIEGDNSHISYLGQLAWMLGNYKKVSKNTQYDEIYDKVCEAINRRMRKAPDRNLRSYPETPVCIPDMLAAVVALKEYSAANQGKYNTTVDEWVYRAKTEWIDHDTGLLKAYVDEEGGDVKAPIRGSNSALNTYFLTFIDDEFAKQQYTQLKKNFRREGLLPGLKEFRDRSPIYTANAEDGVNLLGLSLPGTALAIGSATYFGDKDFREDLLQTAETSGSSVWWNDRRHYLLSDIMPIGEAVILAMRTTPKVAR